MTSRRRRAVQRPAGVLLLLWLLSGMGAAAQEPQEILRVKVRLVTLNVRVADPDGSAVTNLDKESFRLWEDDKEQTIEAFEPLSAPLHVAVIFDTSASTTEHLKLLQGAAKRFLQEFGPADEIALYQVGPEVDRLSEFTRDRKALERAIGRLSSSRRSGTLLYDALAEAFNEFPPEARRRALVVFSDGMDEGSRISFEKVDQLILQGDGSLFAVGPSVGPAPPASGGGRSTAAAEWVVIFDLSNAGDDTLQRMKEAYLAFLGELAPSAQLWVYDYRTYLRSLRPKRFGSGGPLLRALTPEEARLLVSELGSPQLSRFAGPPQTKRYAENILVLTDQERTGLTMLGRDLSLDNATILSPDALTPDRVKQALHLIVHQRDQLQQLVWQQRRQAAQNVQQLADETGGEAWFIDDLQALPDTYAKVAEQIRASHVLGYYSRSAPGRHRLRVVAPGPSVTVRARQIVVTD